MEAVSDNQLNLKWTANSEEDLAHYNVYRDGEVIATSNTNSFSDTGLEASTTYVYKVSAVDTSGNEGLASTEVSETTQDPSPTIPMTAEITDLKINSRKAGKNTFHYATVTVKVTDTTGNGLEGATVSGHWILATSDTEIGTTDNTGVVVFKSDSVKNQPTASFVFVLDDVVLTGYEYNL